MCLEIDYSQHYNAIIRKFTPKIAEQDILVWKVIKGDNSSQFKRFQYSANETYVKVELNVTGTAYSRGHINQGYHAYVSRSTARKFKLRNIYSIEPRDIEKVVKFIIPKGSQYFIGIHDDIVSSIIRSGDLKSQ